MEPTNSTKIYGNEQIKEFNSYYEKMCEINKKISYLTVGDVAKNNLKGLIQGFLTIIKEYEEKVPIEYRESFNFNIGELEEKILKLQEDFIKD